MRTYGTVKYLPQDSIGKPFFVIQCEPHVAIRLKRVFNKIQGNRKGIFALYVSPDNCRDLEWFIERYPLEFDTEAEKIMRTEADHHRERMSLVDRLLNAQCEMMPFDLAVPLRDYQKIATQMALTTGSLLMADDVGLGKTAQAIAMFTDPRTLPALFVTLTHLPKQMVRQINKFAPHLSTHILKKGQPYDLTRKGRFPDVIISNYHKLPGWEDTLAGLVKTVVFDECQELRHQGTNKYSAAERIRDAAQFCVGLSATPIYNYGGEMFNVLNVINPGALGDWNEFTTEWCTVGFSGGRVKAIINDPKAFGSHLRESGLMLRRTRKEAGREIKEPIIVPHTVDTDKAALDKLTAGCAELAKVILAQSESYRGQKMRAADEFDMKMRQATGIAKAPFVAEFVRLLLESEQRVVLYAWHREVYSILLDKLKEFKPVMFTGSESPTQKDNATQQFIHGDSRVMLISLRAGAGLDGLQDVCSVVVFGELDWSPAQHEQCIGRVWRDKTNGEEPEPVVAYYLVAEDGADPFISETLGLKKQQLEGIRDPNRELVQKLQIDPNHIRKLAEGYLEKKGIGTSESAPQLLEFAQEARA